MVSRPSGWNRCCDYKVFLMFLTHTVLSASTQPNISAHVIPLVCEYLEQHEGELLLCGKQPEGSGQSEDFYHTFQRGEEADSDGRGACSGSSSETVTRHCLDMSRGGEVKVEGAAGMFRA